MHFRQLRAGTALRHSFDRGDGRLEPVRIPEELAAFLVKWHGGAGRAWGDALPDLLAARLEHWRLRVDGSVMNGANALIVPVVREDGVRAVLKLQPTFEQRMRDEPVALRAWNGNGAVRLLESDPRSGSMLLERLDARSSLEDFADDLKAFRILSELLARLTAVPAPPGLSLLSDVGAGLLDRVQSALTRPVPESERSLLVNCAAALREVLPEPGDRLLHGDLHFSNILAARPDDPREPWLAIDPGPLAGDPGFDLLPALHNRWEDAVTTGDVPRAVRRRFDLMTEVVGLDRERARAWTLAHILQNRLWDIEHDDTSWHTEPDKAIGLTLLAWRT